LEWLGTTQVTTYTSFAATQTDAGNWRQMDVTILPTSVDGGVITIRRMISNFDVKFVRPDAGQEAVWLDGSLGVWGYGIQLVQFINGGFQPLQIHLGSSQDSSNWMLRRIFYDQGIGSGVGNAGARPVIHPIPIFPANTSPERGCFADVRVQRRMDTSQWGIMASFGFTDNLAAPFGTVNIKWYRSERILYSGDPN